MDLEHPIDAEIRAWLTRHVHNESELSLAIGRSKTWLHKYLNGDGQATIDDLVRLAGLLMGLNVPALSEAEYRLLKAFRAIGADRQPDALEVLENVARGYRRAQRQESDVPAARTPLQTSHKAPGKRKAEG